MWRQVEGTGGQRSGVGAGGLDTTNAMLRSVIDGIADLVYAKDAEGRYLLVNRPRSPPGSAPTRSSATPTPSSSRARWRPGCGRPTGG